MAGFSSFLEEAETVRYRLLVHAYALFENVECPRDDVKLTDDLLKG